MTKTGITRNTPPLVGGDNGEGELNSVHPHPNPLPSREREIFRDFGHWDFEFVSGFEIRISDLTTE
jgi:hypothetical protein